ncbi:DUF6894 family protein [Methylobacterium soli]|uniref:DUF6894 family protein n=1 Tax=Methylobacterium soli TaxID=553447 RepID=UPI00177D4FA0|nr:hypothetical protein [Methylobacterium soli]GJE41499.1 hypothetical protein AEGHOMDF_0665 [Methylobacterium soli]
MLRYYFHLRTPDGLQWDEEGVPFACLDAAYLDACRAIPGMTVELKRAGTRPRQVLRYAFEIADAEGQFLMEVPFSAVLGEWRKPSRSQVSEQKAQAEIQRTRSLIAAVQRERDALYATLSQSHALLARLRALDIGDRGQRQ